MASRTKGFFEQSHSSKKPAQWHRQPQPALKEVPANIPTSRAAIPATSQTKSKLKAFQFDTHETGKAAVHDVNKENRSARRTRDEKDAKVKEILREENGAPENTSIQPIDTPKPPSLPHANTFPSTPSGRLSLEDLIGNGEEVSKCTTVMDDSPQEQIGWNPHSSAYTPHRKRKRARSSSPSYPNSSSQPLEKSAFFDDEAGAEHGKRTPEADPVTALWQAYGGRHAEANLALSEFNHLIAQASPRPMETPLKSGGLRRWASAGNDWPNSRTKNKRRCLDSGTSINLWRDQTDAETGRRSRVASMVQRIQETLATQKLEQEQSPTSSHDNSSPETLSDEQPADAVALPVPSPSKLRQTRASGSTRVAVSRPEADIPKPKPTSLHAPRERSKEANLSQQYGTTKQESIISAPLQLQSKARLPAYKRPSITRAPSQPKVPPSKPQPTLLETDLDEFDDAFDLTADDLDDLLSQAPLKSNRPMGAPARSDHGSQTRRSTETEEKVTTSVAIPTNLDDDDDDEFGCDDIDEASFVQAEFSATQALRISPRKGHSKKFHMSTTSERSLQPSLSHSPTRELNPGNLQLNRYIIKQMIDGEFTNSRGSRCQERILMAENYQSPRTVAITLRGSWLETHVSTGSTIHIAYLNRSAADMASSSSHPGQILINDDEQSPLLVIYPDHMLSATTVADSFDCIRKAVLQDRIKATGETNKAMVYGKILHEIFQQSLSMNRWDARSLAQLTETTVQNHVEGLWELGMVNNNLAVEEIRAKMGEVSAWANVFVMPEPSTTSLVDDQQGDKLRMSISKLIAIEEHVWSPQLGLKGNIDATIESTVIQSSRKLSRLVVPFEVKTGRTTQSAVHRAQTALYTLLLSDRYDINITAGILYYLESSSMSRVAPPVNEIRQMIQQRNRVAAHINSARHPSTHKQQIDRIPQSEEIESSGLPNLLKNPFKCGKCYANQSCFTYHALQENGTAETAGMMDDGKKDHSLVWKEAIGHLHLSAKDQSKAEKLRKWFSKWDRLLTFEEGEQSKVRAELWTMSSEARESIGRCFGKLVLVRENTSKEQSTPTPSSLVDGIEGSGGKINRFTYVFKRGQAFPDKPFTEGSQLTVGEPVVISSEKGQWALANGYVVAVKKHEIMVAVDRKLGTARQRLDNFDEKDNQSFEGIMSTGGVTQEATTSTELYRLDKDEFSNGLALIRNNLVTLMSTHPFHTRLRDQIIFGAKPEFSSSPSVVNLIPSQLGDMNSDQHEAVQKVMSAKDYALILGMPGTGKTTTIAHIIRALIADGQSVLLTSFTHTAVDNILIKIRDIAPAGSILRLGVPAKINDQVKSFCRLAATPRKTIDEIEEAYMGTQIVATTCMGTNHALFNRRAFDVCIVDEASQITLPTILGPLLHARKFILVGDHNQLPPLVQNRSALEGGLDVSLFSQLSEAHPHAVAKLGLQYRMCAEIMSLSNELIYSGQLRCGNSSVATRTLHLPQPGALSTFHPSSSSSSCNASPQTCYLSLATDPSRKAIFLNTDPARPSSLETLSSGGKNITNPLEALLTTHLVLSFLALGVPAKEIGVITLYRSQLALLRENFASAKISREVEIDSADRFQGRDKECVVLSMVRSNEAGIVGELLRDWRRVNVAVTRARSKLVVVGSWGTLGRNGLIGKMIERIGEMGGGVDLPWGGDGDGEGHDFGGWGMGASQQRKKQEEEEEGVGGEEKGKKGLRDSRDAGNRVKKPSTSHRIIEGKRNVLGGSKVRAMRERVAMEIMEDVYM